MPTLETSAQRSRSGLLLRDGLTFLALCGVTLVLFLVTLLVFRSFEAHREVIGERWAARGVAALRAGQAEQAVGALRTALLYRDTIDERLQLAAALAQSGRTDEALNYFQTLRETRPGDGFINLQLARLTRRRGNAVDAIDYYRAAILGNWEGDGTQRRRETRLELAEFLARRGQTSAARDELLIAVGNAPETATMDVLFGDRLAAIGDPTEALELYQKSLALKPHQAETLARAGRLAYSLGRYPEAAKWLSAAVHGEADRRGADAEEQKQLALLAANARRIPELSLSRDLPASERAEHLLLASGIAQRRLQQCVARPLPAVSATPGSVPAAGSAAATPAPSLPTPDARLQDLKTRWTSLEKRLNRRTLERDAALEDEVMALVNDTERQSASLCGAPEGDDALLLLLAKRARTES